MVLTLNMCLPPLIPYITDEIASSEVKVSTLIDNGSHSVLISPDLVDCLELTHCPLPVPKEVELAMVGGVKETFAFVDWVPLGIVSSDQS